MKTDVIEKYVLTVLMCICVCAASPAQTASSYFLEGSYSRYRLNPALAPERGFMALPALGGVSVEANMNAGLANFIYESESKPGSLTTFMSGDVDPQRFLEALPDAVRLNANIETDILSFGFGASRWYFWFDSRLRSCQNVSIPEDMFEFMKSGMSAGDYDICGMNVTTVNYLQTSLGFQIKPVRNLSVGISTNVLFGLAYSKAAVDRIHAVADPDIWKVSTAASVTMAAPGTRIVLDEDGKICSLDCNPDFFHNVGSYGLSVDLGGEYDLKDIVPGLKVSASLTDIGGMLWRNAQVLESDRCRSVEFDGFDNEGSDGIDDDLGELARFRETEDTEFATAFDATFRAGVRYSLPGLDWLAFGELVTMRTGMNELFESRTSVNVSAGNVLDVSGSLAFSNHGIGFGGVLNLHPGGFNLFACLDACTLRLNPQFIPLDKFSCNVSFGIRMGFGERRF